MSKRVSVLVACLSISLSASARTDQSNQEDLDLHGVERKIEDIRRKEHSLRQVLEQDQGELERIKKRVIARGRAYYRLSRAAPRGDFFEYAVQVERLRQALLSDMRRMRRLQEEKTKLGRGLAYLKNRRAPLEVESAAAGQARDALLSKRERERAFELAFSSSRGAKDHTAVYSAAFDLPVSGQSFADMLGRLPFPLPGRAEVEAVRHDYADGPGLVMRASAGAPARAVYSGRIAFADTYPSYGKTVILDHGDDYFTVTSHLSKIDVEVGDELPAGSRLGVSSKHGGMGEIYFEIRRGRETLPPGEWFGI